MRYIVCDNYDDTTEEFESLDGVYEYFVKNEVASRYDEDYPTVYEISREIEIEALPQQFRIKGETTETPVDNGDFSLLDLLMDRGEGNEPYLLRGKTITVSRDTPNDYGTGKLPAIPAGTTVKIDFTGDFGLYGYVMLNGSTQKVRFDLSDLIASDFAHLR